MGAIRSSVRVVDCGCEELSCCVLVPLRHQHRCTIDARDLAIGRGQRRSGYRLSICGEDWSCGSS